MQITMSFFATHGEVIDWMTHLTDRFNLHFALVKYWPKWQALAMKSWSDIATQDVKPNEVWIGLDALATEGSTQMESVRQKPNRLSIHLPEIRPEGLREGMMGTLSEQPTHQKIWKAIMRHFKKNMKSGMWVCNPTNVNWTKSPVACLRTKKFYKNHWYSPMIADLNRQGLSLLPFAGRNIMFVDEPS
jgi:hypothetical protein